jgi:hypothetical protein
MNLIYALPNYWHFPLLPYLLLSTGLFTGIVTTDLFGH